MWVFIHIFYIKYWKYIVYDLVMITLLPLFFVFFITPLELPIITIRIYSAVVLLAPDCSLDCVLNTDAKNMQWIWMKGINWSDMTKRQALGFPYGGISCAICELLQDSCCCCRFVRVYGLSLAQPPSSAWSAIYPHNYF